MPANLICPKCKVYNPDRRKVCWQCGGSLAEAQAAATTTTATATPANQQAHAAGWREQLWAVAGVLLLCGAALGLIYFAFSQAARLAGQARDIPERYDLAWKVAAGAPITYSVVMETAASNVSFDFDQLMNQGQEGSADPGMKQFLQEMFSNPDAPLTRTRAVAMLDKNSQGNISVKMLLESIDFKMPQEFQQAAAAQLALLKGTPLMQGEVTPAGKVVSFYNDQNQMNLLALFFELPGKPVQVDDYWPIELNCITMPASQLTIKTSHKDNRVTFQEVARNQASQRTAILDYAIAEALQGEMTVPALAKQPLPISATCHVAGRGEFLIDEGRWQQFSAAFTIQTTGILTATLTQSFSLQAP